MSPLFKYHSGVNVYTLLFAAATTTTTTTTAAAAAAQSEDPLPLAGNPGVDLYGPTSVSSVEERRFPWLEDVKF